MATLNNVKLLTSKSSWSWRKRKNTKRCWITTQNIWEWGFITKINNVTTKWASRRAFLIPSVFSHMSCPSSVSPLASLKDKSDYMGRNEGWGHTDTAGPPLLAMVRTQAGWTCSWNHPQVQLLPIPWLDHELLQTGDVSPWARRPQPVPQDPLKPEHGQRAATNACNPAQPCPSQAALPRCQDD